MLESKRLATLIFHRDVCGNHADSILSMPRTGPGFLLCFLFYPCLSSVHAKNKLGSIAKTKLPFGEVEQDGAEIEKGWTMFKLEGPLDFSLIGILSKIATTLAVEGISIFAISTYDTDWVLIKKDKKDAATKVLASAGYMWI